MTNTLFFQPRSWNGTGTSNGTGQTAVTSSTWSHTVSTASSSLSTLLVVLVSVGSATNGVTASATYGGTALTAGSRFAIGTGTQDFVQIFYRDNPTVGTANIVVTTTASSTINGAALVVEGVVSRNVPGGHANGATTSLTYVKSHNQYNQTAVISIVGCSRTITTWTNPTGTGYKNVVGWHLTETTTGGGNMVIPVYEFYDIANGTLGSSGQTYNCDVAGLWGESFIEVFGRNLLVSSESYSLTDNVTNNTMSAALSDNSTVTDTSSNQVNRSVTDTVAFAEQPIDLQMNLPISVTDSSTVTDSSAGNATLSLSDSATQQELTSTSSATFSTTDVAATQSELTTTSTAQYTLQDAGTFTESYSFFKDITAVDSSTITESNSSVSTDFLAIGVDASTFTESASLAVFHNLTDTQTQNDVSVGNTTEAANDQLTQNESAPLINLVGVDSSVQSDSYNNVGQFIVDQLTLTDSSIKGLFGVDTLAQTELTALPNPKTTDSATQSETVNPTSAWVYKEEIFDFVDIMNLLVTQPPREDTFTLNEFAVVEEAIYRYDNLYEYPPVKTGQPFRIIAQDHFTRQFIHWDLPLDNVTVTYSLSGPNLLRGALTTEIESMLGLDPPLIPYRTWLYVEEDGIIRGAFLMTPPVDDNANKTRMIEAEGFSVYPSWIYYMGPPITGIQLDPADVVRFLWQHCQSFPDGNLGVQVTEVNTPVRLGSPMGSVEFQQRFLNGVGQVYDIQGGPYNINHWSGINVGDEIEKLCKETPIEYIERFVWNTSRTDVLIHLELGYPRVGTRRQDIVFKEGMNLKQVIPSFQENPDSYASDVFVIGAGDGPGSINWIAQQRIGRIRKVALFQDQDIITPERAKAIANFELNRRANSRYDIQGLVVDLDYYSTPFGSFNAGDDVWVDGTVIYSGRITGWYRIIEWEYNPYSHEAIVSVLPSESFTYGRTNTDPLLDLPTSGVLVPTIPSDGRVPTDGVEINTLMARLEGCRRFSEEGCKPGEAIVYRVFGDVYGWWVTYHVFLSEALPPNLLIAGRTEYGNILVGEEISIYGYTGQAGVLTDNMTPTNRTSTSPFPQPAPIQATPLPQKTSLMAAGEELLARFDRRGQIYEDFSFNGMSSNLKYWNDRIADMYWDLGGRNLGMRGFLVAVANGSRT